MPLGNCPVCPLPGREYAAVMVVEVRWLHNGAEVTTGARYETASERATDQHAVCIQPVMTGDEGTLTAIASNALGTASHTARLAVISGPQQQQQQWQVNGVTAALPAPDPYRDTTPGLLPSLLSHLYIHTHTHTHTHTHV